MVNDESSHEFDVCKVDYCAAVVHMCSTGDSWR